MSSLTSDDEGQHIGEYWCYCILQSGDSKTFHILYQWFALSCHSIDFGNNKEYSRFTYIVRSTWEESRSSITNRTFCWWTCMGMGNWYRKYVNKGYIIECWFIEYTIYGSKGIEGSISKGNFSIRWCTISQIDEISCRIVGFESSHVN